MTHELETLRVQKMLDLLPTNNRLSVLDLGCCEGEIASEIKRRGHLVLGIDNMQKYVDMTAKRGILTKQVDLEKEFPFADETFDCLFAGEIIEHIYNTEGFLRECKRILKKDGIFILSTPNINWLSYRLQMLFGKTLPYGIESGKEGDFNGHCRYYTVDSLTKTLAKYGFKVEVMRASQITNRAFPFSKLADAYPSIGYQLVVKAVRQ